MKVVWGRPPGDWGAGWGCCCSLGSGRAIDRAEGGEAPAAACSARGPAVDGAAPAGRSSGDGHASQRERGRSPCPRRALVAEPSPPDDGQGLAVVLASS